MRIEFNVDHVRVVLRLFWRWVWFVALALILGWHLGPRVDEVLFVLFVVPALALAAYIAFCFAVAATKSLWPLATASWRRSLRGIGVRKDVAVSRHGDDIRIG
jgi:hypothetical protein